MLWTLPAQSSLGTGWTLVWAKPSVHWPLPILFCWRLVYEQTDCFSTLKKQIQVEKRTTIVPPVGTQAIAIRKEFNPKGAGPKGHLYSKYVALPLRHQAAPKKKAAPDRVLFFPACSKKKRLHYRPILLHSFSPKNMAEDSQGYCIQWGAVGRTSPGTEHTNDSFTVAQQQETGTKRPNAVCLLAAQALHPFICTKQLVRDATHCCATYKATKKSEVFVLLFFSSSVSNEVHLFDELHYKVISSMHYPWKAKYLH